MIAEVALLLSIYIIWLVTLVSAVVSADEASLTISTTPFLLTLPFSFLISAVLNVYLPRMLEINLLLTLIVGILMSARWCMAIVSE